MWVVNFFHVQILVLECLFCFRLQKKKMFWLRLIPAVAAYLALPYVIPGGFFSPLFSWGWFTFGFLLMFLLSGALLWFCFRMHIRQLIFYCCAAHTIQHIVHCLYRITELVFVPSYTVAQLCQLVYMLVACGLVWYFLRERFGSSETVDIRNGHLVVFAAVSTLLIYVFSYWSTSRETDTVGMEFFDCFSCILLLMILLDIFRIRKAEKEQMLMERMLRQEQEQHEISSATVDVINRKCHDLRHQIAALRNMSSEEQERSIAELENAVLIYDSFPKSGNKDVDLILAEKSLLAEKHHIVIRSIVDGSRLSFMAVEELYSLLGNALDNAIEATTQEKDVERRIITLHAAARGNLMTIHVENPCEKEPLFMDGLPLTSKPDTDYHGYGMRSMRYLCEKYKGVLTTSWDEGIFSLDILFPLEN